MIHANVESDKAERVITLTVEPEGSAWDLNDENNAWRKKPRYFRPSIVRLVLTQAVSGITEWQVQSVYVSGGVVLVGGGTSAALKEGIAWHSYARSHSGMPEWLREIAEQAPCGIQSFTWTDKERAGEVQEL